MRPSQPEGDRPTERQAAHGQTDAHSAAWASRHGLSIASTSFKPPPQTHVMDHRSRRPNPRGRLIPRVCPSIRYRPESQPCGIGCSSRHCGAGWDCRPTTATTIATRTTTTAKVMTIQCRRLRRWGWKAHGPRRCGRPRQRIRSRGSRASSTGRGWCSNAGGARRHGRRRSWRDRCARGRGAVSVDGQARVL